MADRFEVRLTQDQRYFLSALLDSGRCSPGTLTRALILRSVDVSETGLPRRDEDIARTVHASPSTVFRVRKRFAEGGLHAALFPKGRPPLHRVLAPFVGG